MNYEDKLDHHERKFKTWLRLALISLTLAFINFNLAKFALVGFAITAILAIYHIQTAGQY